MSPMTDLAVVDRLLPGQHLEQRRLAGAVRTDDADDPGAGECERQILDQQAVAEPLAEVVDLDHRVTQSTTDGNGDLQTVRPALGGLGLGLQLVVGRESGLALGLAGLRRHPHPLQLALQRALAGLVALLLAGKSLLLLLEPRRVVALERDAAAAVQLEDPLGDVVEEVAVVGDGHDGARILLQEALQPLDALGVEVVGRLVEQQQVGVG